MKTIIFVEGVQVEASCRQAMKLLEPLALREDIHICLFNAGEAPTEDFGGRMSRSFPEAPITDTDGYLADINEYIRDVVDDGEDWHAIVACDLSRNCFESYKHSALLAASAIESEAACGECDEHRAAYIGACADGEAGCRLSPDAVESLKSELAKAERARPEDFGESPASYLENPFDIAVNMKLEACSPQMRHPLIALLQLLGGLPGHVLDPNCVGLDSQRRSKCITNPCRDELLSTNPVYAKYFGGEVSRRELGSERQDCLTAGEGIVKQSDLEELRHRYQDDLTAMETLWARELYPESDAVGYDLRTLKLSRRHPLSLVAVSFRMIPDNESNSTLQADTGGIGSLNSEFCIRNHYPDSARFVVFDADQRDVETIGGENLTRAEFEYWQSVMMLAVNPGLIGKMQAYSLYRVNTTVDFERYVESISAKWSLAQSAYAWAQREIDYLEGALRPGEKEEQGIPDHKVNILVRLGDFEDGDIGLDPHRYGWLKDSQKVYPPEFDEGVYSPKKMTMSDEFKNLRYGLRRFGIRVTRKMGPLDEERFGQDYLRIDDELTEVLRAPRRAMALASDEFHKVPGFSEDTLTGVRLNKYDCLDFSEDLMKEEMDLASDYSLTAINSDAWRERQKLLGDKVKERMRPRAYLREAALVALIIQVAVALAFVPYVFGMLGGEGASLSALGITLAVMAMLLIVGFIPLKLSHIGVRRTLKKFNDNIHSLTRDLRQKMGHFGRRISRYASYRKGYSLLAAQDNQAQPYTGALVELHRKRREIRDILHVFGNGFGLPIPVVSADEVDAFTSWAEADAALLEPGYFEMFPLTVFKQCPLDDGYGLCPSVQAPYEFIGDMSLARLTVLEPDESEVRVDVESE